MLTTALFLAGAAPALWIVLRNPGYSEQYTWWPTWPEWAVGTCGVGLIGVAMLRVAIPVLVLP